MLVAAVAHLGIAFSTFNTDDVVGNWLSSALFFLAAAGCLHSAWQMENIRVVAFTGAFTMTAYASRAALVVWSWVLGQTELSNARIWLTIFTWGLMAIYAYAIFVRGIAPLSRLYRIQKLAREECR